MSDARVEIAEDATALALLAAERVRERLEGLARDGTRPLALGLAGGSTPLALYRFLAEAPRAARLPWDRLLVFWSDERCVSPESPQSNYGAARRVLLSRVGIPKDRIRRFLVESGALEAARAADADLRERTPHGLDLLLLGVGEDGHTASLFPGSPALEEARAWAAAAVAPDGGERVTLTLPFIRLCSEVWVLASGERKRDVVRRALAGDAALPIGRLQAARPLTWLLDRAAAGGLAP